MGPRDVSHPALPAGAFRPELDRSVPAFHWRGFAALVRRELKRMVKMAPMVAVAPALMSAIYFTCFAFGLAGERGTDGGDAVLSFLVPGLVMMSVLTQAGQNTAFSLFYSKIEGMVLDQLMAPISARETVLAYILAGTSAGLLAGLAVGVTTALMWPMAPAHPWALPLFAGLGAALLAVGGLLAALASHKWDHVVGYFTFIFVPLIFLSGVFAPVDRVPEGYRWLLTGNPVFHAVDGFRWAFLGVGHGDPATHAGVLLGTILVLYAITARLYAVGWRLKS